MAGTFGNINATGNSGGKPYSKENREKAATLKGLSLDWMIKILKSKSKTNALLREKIVLRIATTCIPQEIKHSGNEDNQTPIPIINIDPKNNVPIHNSNTKDNEDEEEIKDRTGRN